MSPPRQRTTQTSMLIIHPTIGITVPRIVDRIVKTIHRTTQAMPKTIDCAACHRTTASFFSMRKKMMPVMGGTR